MHALGENLPHESNQISLNYDKLDKWGMPTLDINCECKENDEAISKDILEQRQETLEKLGAVDISGNDNRRAPGLDIREMGYARMDRDSETSVLNGNNQVHGCSNVFVTDDASMTSSACQNPSLTSMAMPARAGDFAVRSLKAKEI